MSGSVTCPECEATLNLKEVVQGEIVQCPDCGVDLEVVAVESVESWSWLRWKKKTGGSSPHP